MNGRLGSGNAPLLCPFQNLGISTTLQKDFSAQYATEIFSR